jgi:hypothetical protein
MLNNNNQVDNSELYMSDSKSLLVVEYPKRCEKEDLSHTS